MWPCGKWWPIFVPDFYGKRCSQHPFDTYSFTHILHGFIFYGLWGYWPTQFLEVGQGRMWVWIGGAIIALMLEFGWECLENSEYVLKKYRKSVGTSEDYKGDSYQNSLGDIISCISGYYISVACVDLGVWYVPIIWTVASELLLAFFIHDGLALTIIQLFFAVKWIKKWQESIIPKSKEKKEM